MENNRSQKLFWIVLILTALAITINGILTEVNLGDESHHYRLAQNIYREGKRVAFDPLYGTGNPPGFYYNTPPLWHMNLALLWKTTGGISQALAQVYHILFFILLTGITYQLAQEHTGKEGGWFSALIIGTMPMVVSFSTLFYMDIPMTALSLLSYFLLVKRRYLEAGMGLGAAFFTKQNSLFFFPGFVFLIFWVNRKNLFLLFRNIIYFTLPIFLIYFLDLRWRKQYITAQLDTASLVNIAHRISTNVHGKQVLEYLNSYLTNPMDLVKYFGIPIFILMILFICKFNKRGLKKIHIWVPLASYLIFLALLFGIQTDIRYLMPIVPFLTIMISPTMIPIKRKWAIFFTILCAIQFVSTIYYVHQKRKIPSAVKEGYEYIRKNVGKESFILYPEENLLLYGERKVIWSSFGRGKGLGTLFWLEDEREINCVLEKNRIAYILIKKSRIYDDQKGRHLGGYPQSFVKKLPNLSNWEMVFDNSEVVLWKKTGV